MNIYFDTEFTGLVPGTTLISIGMVTDDNKKFYGVFDDYNKDLCDDWINENVIKNLKMIDDMSVCYAHGWSSFIRDELKIWLDEVSHGEQIQLVSDVCHYDMTLLCNLFGGAFNLPKNVNPVCYDICQDLWAFLEEEYEDLSKQMQKSFDISREELIDSINLWDEDNKPKGPKHNALYDAEVIRYLYKSFMGEG